MERKANKGGKTAVILLMILCTVVIVFCGYRLWESDQEYAVGDETYDSIEQAVLLIQQTDEAEASKKDTDTLPAIPIPDLGLDFKALKALNEDAGAWLYCPDTVINYPVMIAEDYSYYLRHLPDGTYNKNGALFTDYNCAPDFTDRLSIIYGHNMKSKKMFGSLDMYKDAETLKSHPYLYMYTEGANYRLEPMYGLVIGANVWRNESFSYQENADELMEYARAKATVLHELSDYNDNCRVIALSTCTYEFRNARFVVLCAMRQVDGTLALYEPSTEKMPAATAESKEV